MTRRLTLIKVGGQVVENDVSLAALLHTFVRIPSPKILIHGGGKMATKIGDKLGITSQYIQGRRITDTDTIDLVTMVYGGLINKKITAQLNALQCPAIGLSGMDANVIPARLRPSTPIDYGWVGDIDPQKINTTWIDNLLQQGITPVFAPLSHDEQGHILNVNADTVASSLAVAMSSLYATRLVFCFDKKGILTDINDNQSVIKTINHTTFIDLKNKNVISDGAIPKLDNAFQSLQQGVHDIVIGNVEDLLDNTTAHPQGTLIIH